MKITGEEKKMHLEDKLNIKLTPFAWETFTWLLSPYE